ncbi:hypothetical protein NL676_037813 [Syzygium grande]|nr:hypothetical protein NL676_037813 [Syzygium grande]
MTPVAATHRAPPPFARNVSSLPNSPSAVCGPSASAARDRRHPPSRERLLPRLTANTWLPKPPPAASDPLPPSRSLAPVRRASRRKADAVPDAVEGAAAAVRGERFRLPCGWPRRSTSCGSFSSLMLREIPCGRSVQRQ